MGALPVHNADKALDIAVFYGSKDFLWHDVYKDSVVSTMKYTVTKFEWVNFLGIKMLVPMNRIAFCEQRYGANATHLTEAELASLT